VKDKPVRTRTGRVLSDTELDALADEVEAAEYDVDELKSRRRGRPRMGSAPAEVVPVRLDPELRTALQARAGADGVSASEVIRSAIREYLDS
jgi:Arc/MetJ-type ribon-helix-helix transcriptional regulator